MKLYYRILEILDQIFDFLGSDLMFYVIIIWFILIFIRVSI